MIDVLYDHTDNKVFVIEPKEEVIIKKEGTNDTLFYCTYFERVHKEIHKSFPRKATKKEFRDAVGEFLIFFYQGITFIKRLHKINIYFGDFKPANLMVTFEGK